MESVLLVLCYAACDARRRGCSNIHSEKTFWWQEESTHKGIRLIFFFLFFVTGIKDIFDTIKLWTLVRFFISNILYVVLSRKCGNALRLKTSMVGPLKKRVLCEAKHWSTLKMIKSWIHLVFVHWATKPFLLLCLKKTLPKVIICTFDAFYHSV